MDFTNDKTPLKMEFTREEWCAIAHALVIASCDERRAIEILDEACDCAFELRVMQEHISLRDEFDVLHDRILYAVISSVGAEELPF